MLFEPPVNKRLRRQHIICFVDEVNKIARFCRTLQNPTSSTKHNTFCRHRQQHIICFVDDVNKIALFCRTRKNPTSSTAQKKLCRNREQHIICFVDNVNKINLFLSTVKPQKKIQKPLASGFEVIANPQNGQVGAIHLKGSCKGEHPFECTRGSRA